MNEQKPIMVDADNVPNMKCYCGCDIFVKVFNLKYLSPILVGNPKGGAVTVFQFQCILCKQLYPEAMPQGDVQKIYNSLPNERKKLVKALRQKVKEAKEKIEGDHVVQTG